MAYPLAEEADRVQPPHVILARAGASRRRGGVRGGWPVGLQGRGGPLDSGGAAQAKRSSAGAGRKKGKDEERTDRWDWEARPRGGVLGLPKKREEGRVGPPGCAGLKTCFLFS
jgi:hypothetical protein